MHYVELKLVEKRVEKKEKEKRFRVRISLARD